MSSLDIFGSSCKRFVPSDGIGLEILEVPCMRFVESVEDKIEDGLFPLTRDEVEKYILNNEEVRRAIQKRYMLGYHVVEGYRYYGKESYCEVSHAVEDLWIPKNSDGYVYGRFRIFDTPLGRIVRTLLQTPSKNENARLFRFYPLVMYCKKEYDEEVNLIESYDPGYELVTFNVGYYGDKYF